MKRNKRSVIILVKPVCPICPNSFEEHECGNCEYCGLKPKKVKEEWLFPEDKIAYQKRLDDVRPNYRGKL